MRFYSLIILFFPTLLFGQNKRHFMVKPDTAGKPVTYGSVITLHFYEEKKGELKELGPLQVRRLVDIKTVTPGCTIRNVSLTFSSNPSRKDLVSARVSLKPKVSTVIIDTVAEIKMNFRDNLVLNYNGAPGSGGNNGKNGGEGFFKDCGDCWGTNGSSGRAGINGSNVTIRIRKETDTLLNKEVYFLYATDLNSGRKAVYRYTDLSYGIVISANGGEGAWGGSGGNGKDGEDTDPPTDGADGGDGGDGANGGDGGTIKIIVHPNAVGIKDHIQVSVNGGKGGPGGTGGKGGKGGSYRYSNTNIYTAHAGRDGRDGSAGRNGVNGSWDWVVEEF